MMADETVVAPGVEDRGSGISEQDSIWLSVVERPMKWAGTPQLVELVERHPGSTDIGCQRGTIATDEHRPCIAVQRQVRFLLFGQSDLVRIGDIDVPMI